MAKTQNWRMAPREMDAIRPRIAIYERTFKVLEVPARPRPSAMRCFTGSVTDVLPTASTCKKTDNELIGTKFQNTNTPS